MASNPGYRCASEGNKCVIKDLCGQMYADPTKNPCSFDAVENPYNICVFNQTANASQEISKIEFLEINVVPCNNASNLFFVTNAKGMNLAPITIHIALKVLQVVKK